MRSAFDPHNAHAWNNLGLLHYEAGDLQAALADFNQALAINPRLADAYHNRVLAFLSLNQLPEAEADFARYRALGGTIQAEVEQFWREVKARHQR